MNVSDWQDREETAARLVSANMRPPCADDAAQCFVQAAAAIREARIGSGAPVVACWVPGRIEVLGKHTDYCGGESILATAERGFSMIAVPRDDSAIRIIDARNRQSIDFMIHEWLEPQLGHWSNYPQTVCRRIARNFPLSRRGATIAFASDLPPSSGMSSSSALVVSTFLSLAGINQLARDATYAQVIRATEDLAGYLSTVENGMSFGPFLGNEGVGTFGGSEDHTAILCGKPDELVQYAFCPVRYQRSIALSDHYIFAIASSGVTAKKTSGAREKYNRLSALASAITKAWRSSTKRAETSLAAILDSTPDAADRLRNILADDPDISLPATDLIGRLEHFIIERRLIQTVPHTISPETVEQFGNLVRSSHNAAIQLLKNQTPETIQLATIAEKLGAHTASAFGAGFGGSVWALVDRETATAFSGEWQERFCTDFPALAERAEFFLMRPGPPAIEWSLE
jgi:galactokinase